MFHVEHSILKNVQMQVSQLKISGLRNIVEANLRFNAHFNLFFGSNGAGKTSILEAICLLTSGKSFRTHHADEAIQFSASAYVLAGIVQSRTVEVLSTRMGVERNKNGRQKIRVNEAPLESMAELAKILPVQLLTVSSYRLLEEGPLSRRQFLDWGVFHVEHSFAGLWQRFNRALRQRNMALTVLKNTRKAEIWDASQVHIWEQELCSTGHAIDALRVQYMAAWFPIFSRILEEILGIRRLKVHYKRGWNAEETLENALKTAFSRDQALGYTTVGPHRADLEFEIEGIPAKIVLSRGQLKLFICALFLARSEALFEKTGKKCLFMIDDLNAELDNKAARLLIERLECLQAQVIITAIEKEPLVGLLKDREYQMFHVEHGVVSLNRGLIPSLAIESEI